MIISLLNQKSVVGKTTLAVHLAGAFAKRGLRVMLVDADPQGSAPHRRFLAPRLCDYTDSGLLLNRADDYLMRLK